MPTGVSCGHIAAHTVGGSPKREPCPSTSGPGILVIVIGNFLHEHHDPAPQGGIINSQERSDQP